MERFSRIEQENTSLSKWFVPVGDFQWSHLLGVSLVCHAYLGNAISLIYRVDISAWISKGDPNNLMQIRMGESMLYCLGKKETINRVDGFLQDIFFIPNSRCEEDGEELVSKEMLFVHAQIYPFLY